MSNLLYFAGAVVVFFLLLQLFVWFSGYKKRGHTVPELNGELGRRIKSGQRLLLYFYSPACGACRSMTPLIEKMQNENKNVVKINVVDQSGLARQLGVWGTPATVVVENARIDQFILGARPESYLRKLL
jgi:thioredoxin-like negative regulator of GroEL